jgi:putative multiple sugar transport system substrate-binding protein
MKRSIIAVVLVLSILLGAFVSVSAADQKLIGISMPTKSSERWIKDGETMKAVFEEMGYKADLQFAEDEIPNQVAQIENMVAKGADVLVIAAIDGSTLSDVLAKAKEQCAGIAYDRLISKTADVDFYATFDNFVMVSSWFTDRRRFGSKTRLAHSISNSLPVHRMTQTSLFYNGAMSICTLYRFWQTVVQSARWFGHLRYSPLDGAVAQLVWITC